MSENMKKIILTLSVVYVLSAALICSGIAYAGGISSTKLFLFWFFFASGIIILLAKVNPV